jgi:hypothetical protein
MEDPMSDTLSRRRFLSLFPLAGAGAALLGVPALVRPLGLWAGTGSSSGMPGNHPDPRPGIDGSTVLTAEDLAHTPHVVEIYDGIREIPHIADGIRCYCGCADLPGTRSLLSCYEEGGMAPYCDICQGEGRLAHRRHREGQSLDQIRRAIDARYGT